MKHLNMKRETQYEQHKPPTKDKVVQINMGDDANPKPILLAKA